MGTGQPHYSWCLYVPDDEYVEAIWAEDVKARDFEQMCLFLDES